ncbi:Crp/Fnr family transcriptional regulator [Limibaculum sp. M0105]|uniref:Crp/Fnr family transcriptional regulator n=1 Tax=Thermohalobaculum xanthum TaxID=2753746 RepID=A0A8J7M5Y9_9RHOB|nr:Crp/Fnr family transcriptional regulator [Thermohalobaculum xanthum]MBK0398718.1 Crp/Fnr family transcriptional regulator [Thermohalobaculum xanthum]
MPTEASDFPEGSTLDRCGVTGRAALAAAWTEASYSAGTMVVSADDTDDDVFFILSGRARAATYTNQGKEVMLSDLAPGESFGIFAAIDGRPRSTNVVAIDDSRLARMTAQRFNEVLYSNRDVTRAFLQYLIDRIRHLSERVTDVTTLNAEQRLIVELLRLSTPDPARPGTAVVDPLPTQQELATIIFSQRESVGRDMSKLKDLGLLDRKGRSLRILDVARLRERVGGA